MKIHELINLENIIQYSYDEIDSDGVFLETLWGNIKTGNLNLNLEESFKALIVVLRFLLDNKLIALYGLYDIENKREVVWEGDTNGVLKLLNQYLNNFSKKEIKKNPAFLDQFKYCIITWKVDWPIDLEKYGIKSA